MADNNKSGIFKIAMNLVCTCLVSGCIIGLVFFITGPTAAAKAEQMKQDSMKALVDADQFVPVPGETDTFIAQKGGQKVAYIIPTAPKGYGGPIKMLTAVSMDGKVIDYTVLEANETPGLGDRGAKSPFKDQFKGKKAENLEVTKNASEKDKIQAMTGATISSRAFTKGVKEAVEKAAQLGGK
ncbi:RnfABCDGE type electron transport complex subunit G [Megasphaera hexanoica]|jgi:electron transport complex protein RnfG|uniref:Ion-translocating oxidoreductase complex subunit G n=1 Tax=Megasphaera hexanoica TaxID=1675036 RepID=A0A848BXE4_9FIRM|nr:MULTISPECIES: RnfABCDGE type electron transport complex subunit G [Megasphaera]AXB81558.1 RnfABCDGE type electron transport complex subunit G [Megasphaera hexanoica]KUH56109.1 RnfABCDGE type electron transport complex subunit G [Megasphaera sp. DJF_B143]MCI5532666.1 RnfABCDGE type electron transport complex subunit G [Caecibacter massiliensis]NME27707.1 RnfABCDGE type electron transport complex subunit G [Megasphaera hexanoica]